MSMITGSWGTTVLVCGNHPHMDNPPEMSITAGPHSLFYACPKYDALNREDNEAPCFNRINLIDYEKVLEHLADVITEAEDRDEQICLLHHKWKRKSMQFEVLEHSADRIVVKFLDTLATQGRKF